MAPIKVHGIVMSPPVRAVMLTCKALDIEYDFHLVNTIRGDHKTPEFLKVTHLPFLFVLFSNRRDGV